MRKPTTPMTDVPVIRCGSDEPRADSRDLAKRLGTQHESTYKLLKAHKQDFETFGILRFQIGEIDGQGQPEKYAMLNEDQAYLLLTYSRNTAKVRELKIKLVKSFGEARRAAMQHGAEYLPTYHQLHDQIHALANGSPNERWAHVNANKLVNKAVGIEAGQRGTVSLPTQSMLCVAQMMVTKAMQSAPDHHIGYQLAKDAVKPLLALAE